VKLPMLPLRRLVPRWELWWVSRLGGPVGAIAGAAVTPVLEKWASLCIAEFKRRGSVVVEAAAVSSGLPENEVLESSSLI
jgi:hypothetical protein